MKQTTLDLNGPILGFSTNPQDVTVNNAGIATFIGIASAYFISQNPTNIFASNTGIVTHRWYAAGIGALSDGTNTTLKATLSGTATTTLTVSSVTSPTTSGIQFFVSADYIPSAYQTSSPITAGTGRSTGNAINEILFSNTATLTVRPLISVVTNPTSASVTLNVRANFSAGGSSSDGTSVSYRWQLNNDDIFDSSNISGSGTSNLSVSLPSVSSNTVRAKISHPTASNSPIFTNSTNFIVVNPRSILNVEDMGSVDIFENFDIANGPIIQGGNRNPGSNYTVHAPERDIRVRITLQGAAGKDRDGFKGGQGGVSVYEYTFEKNVEYVFKMGGDPFPIGGLNGGGGVTQMYRKSVLVAGVGGGGGSGGGTFNTRPDQGVGKGGDGGGIGFAGESGGGAGTRGGNGGRFASPGEYLPGYFSSGSNGGQASSCMRGDTIISLTGISACNDFPGLTQAKNDNNNTIQNTAFINRGYKPGPPNGYRNNGGDGFRNEGGGGSGAYGGNAAPPGSGSGGGGGSGYTNGSIVLINSQLGGNTSAQGFITIQLIS